MTNIIGLVVSVFFMAIIILSGKLFEKAGKEASRKFIHIMLSNWWIIAMIFFDNMWVAALLPAVFVVVNYISFKTNLIKVMERDEGAEDKDSLGTVYYALSLLILAIITFGPLKNPMIGLCGILVMGYGDGLAAVIGQAIESKKFKVAGNTKSVAGCITMCVITCTIMAGFLYYNKAEYWAIKSIVIGGLMTLIEAVSIKGTENITVPLLTSLLAFLMV